MSNFIDSIQIFLDYIIRQLNKDPDYHPHPIIRAFMNALEAVEEVEVGELVAAEAHEEHRNSIHNAYIVVLEKKERSIELKSIESLTVNTAIPIDVLVSIFRIQIKLDKFPGETILASDMTTILHDVLDDFSFCELVKIGD